MSRVTLSTNEIKELTLSVAMLPFPPIPVRLKSYTNVIDIDLDKDKHNAFEMATLQLRKDANAEDGILNSHSVISAIILYNRWRPKTASTDVENKELIAKMDMEKTKATIRLQYGVFSIIKADGDGMNKQDEIYNLFFKITQEWIDIMSPEPGNIMLEPISDIESIGREHPLHIVASHYCYAQVNAYMSVFDFHVKCFSGNSTIFFSVYVFTNDSNPLLFLSWFMGIVLLIMWDYFSHYPLVRT